MAAYIHSMVIAAISASFLWGAAIAKDAYPDPEQCTSWCQRTYERCRLKGSSTCEVFRQDCAKDCSPGRVPDRFGAIAYDEKTKALGYSTNYATRAEADRRGLSECKSSRNGCRVVVHFTDGCAALAVDNKSNTWGWGISGLSKDEAELNAMSGCTEHGGQECRVNVSVCNQSG